MPRTYLTPTTLTDAGVDPATHLAAANALGHSIDPDTILQVHNGGGGSINVTVQTGSTKQGKAVADSVIAVAGGHDALIAGLRGDLYANESGADQGLIYVDFSAVTSVTVAVYKD